MTEELYLGIDGGQSHTEAVIADRAGHILGRGRGGPSNHAELPGGPERLEKAIRESVGNALKTIGELSINDTIFAAVHCAMTGGAEDKKEIIGRVLSAHQLSVGHDAGGALSGAMGGKPGIVVIAGTGSVAYGEDRDGNTWQAGGWGYLLGDEGGGYWIAKEAVRHATLEYDGLGEATALSRAVLKHFNCTDLQMVDRFIYSNRITRDQLATLSVEVHRVAAAGDAVANRIIEQAGEALARLAVGVARKLSFPANETFVAGVGGVFRAELMRKSFAERLREYLPVAQVVEPRFGPAVGALLLAYRAAGLYVTEALLTNLDQETSADSHTAREGKGSV